MQKIVNGRERTWLLKEKYSGVESPAFFADLARLENGEPVDYVIGFVDFLGCRISLEEKPLIPRTETAWWVEQLIAACKEKAIDKQLKILDVFSGSGCIGIALAKHLPNTQVLCAEVDPALISLIQRNAKENNVKNVTAVQSDIFTNVPREHFDLIVANPPYLSQNRTKDIQASVLAHEPHLALFADDDGLFFLKKVLQEAPEYLAENGALYMELDPWQKEVLESWLSSLPKLNKPALEWSFQRDQFDSTRLLKSWLQN